MKRSTAAVFLFLLFISYRAATQDTVLIFHPTAYNLQVIEKLVEEGILALDGYHIMGVYHEKEHYDYKLTEQYLEQNPTELFSLKSISGPLVPDDLFGPNNCTRQFRQLFNISHGALFMGGPDIPPAAYKEPVHLLTRVTDPFRHYVEASYIFHLLGGSQRPGWEPYMENRSDYLISGICLGMQTMNVATGGTLVQDIPSEIYGIWNVEEILALPPDQMHRNYADMVNTGCDKPTSYHFHRIDLGDDSFLSGDAGYASESDPLVLSSHHQAVEKLGTGLEVAALSMDGKIVEAIENGK
ncbi:MAG: gamma-glutamyl-gamma-aminobutyrate hydrolase family protein, partial [Bacteroidales bacterium]|nr:gamma-glutamyl-gamma-aminobutyrate hydrolase family protein [Bacteroidales bacterium]